MKKQIGMLVAIMIILFSTNTWAGGVTILQLNRIGRVVAHPMQHRITFVSYGGPMEFSLCYNELYWQSSKGLYRGIERCLQGEVGGWGKPAFRTKVRTLKMPHYRTFTVTIGRYNRLAVAVCRENDGRIGCVHMLR